MRFRFTRRRSPMYFVVVATNEAAQLMTRNIRILAAVVVGLLFLGFVAAPIARACTEDSGITLFDGELPGGG